MDFWGLGTGVITLTIGVICLAVGYRWGASEPKRSGWDAPGRCTWQEVERPTAEKTQAERQFDEIIGDPWRNTP